ncbi:MAG TPA: 5-formyltetrahydrofolate cyclo-ligase [Gammaproteobacteria bacterium]
MSPYLAPAGITVLNTATPPPTTRTALRRALRARRRELSGRERSHAARQVARWLARLPALQRAARVGVYLANDGEIDLAPLVRRLWRQRRPALFLPVLGDRPQPRLRYARYTPATPLRPNRFGIPEPFQPRRCLLPARALDVLLVPLVAFDRDGNRLGMGGGYFDRTLAYLLPRRAWRRPRLVGVGYAFQQLAALPAARWDVPLQQAVTERGPVSFSPTAESA